MARCKEAEGANVQAQAMGREKLMPGGRPRAPSDRASARQQRQWEQDGRERAWSRRVVRSLLLQSHRPASHSTNRRLAGLWSERAGVAPSAGNRVAARLRKAHEKVAAHQPHKLTDRHIPTTALTFKQLLAERIAYLYALHTRAGTQSRAKPHPPRLARLAGPRDAARARCERHGSAPGCPHARRSSIRAAGTASCCQNNITWPAGCP